MRYSKLSVSDILKLTDADISRLNAKELKILTQKVSSAANKRIARLEKSKLASRSSAYRSLRGGIKHKGKLRKFSTDAKKLKIKPGKGQSRNKLLKEFARASRFLNDKTSTITGTRSVLQDVKKRIGEFKSKAQENRFWDAYTAIESDYKVLIDGRKLTSDEVQAMMYERMFPVSSGKKTEKSFDRLMDEMKGYMERRYVEEKKSEEPRSAFSVKYEKIKIFDD